MNITKNHKIMTVKTNDGDLSNLNLAIISSPIRILIKDRVDPQIYQLNDLIAYLNESPRHAIVITGLAEESSQCAVYVLRGAGEDLNNFYWGSYPVEDPADGGDLTAEEAVDLALDLLCF